MCSCTATTTTEHNMQMVQLEAVTEASCDHMSEGVGSAKQRSAAECTWNIPLMWHHISNINSSTLLCERYNIQRDCKHHIAMLSQTMACCVCKQECTDWTRLTPIVIWRGITRPSCI